MMLRDDILQRLRDLDRAVDVNMDEDDDRRFRMIVVGGGALILMQTLTRATMDIDVLEVDPAVQEFLEDYDMNMRVKAYADTFSYNLENRLVPIMTDTFRIEVYAASPEDIVIAKLCSPRPKDRHDIIDDGLLSAIDWEVLERIALDEDEVKANMLNERMYSDFLYDYNEYVRRYRPCER